MKRLFFLTKSLDSVENVSHTMEKNGVDYWHFHVLSKDEDGVIRRRLHTANIFQRLDIIHSMQRGMIWGLSAGLIVVLVVTLIFSDLRQEVHPLFWMAMTAFFAMFGTWVGGLSGVHFENYKIRRFHDHIEKGMHLIMIDVPRDQEPEVRSLMAQYHPEAKWQGAESTWDNPFKGDDGKAHFIK